MRACVGAFSCARGTSLSIRVENTCIVRETGDATGGAATGGDAKGGAATGQTEHGKQNRCTCVYDV